jgi:CBS domain-containing protein
MSATDGRSGTARPINRRAESGNRWFGPVGPVVSEYAGAPWRSIRRFCMGKSEHRVADVMTIDPIVVDIHSSLEEADHLLRSTYITGIPVVDDEGVLVGVISHAHLTVYRFGHRDLSLGDPADRSGAEA